MGRHMVTITNLLNGPYQVQLSDGGSVMIAANETLENISIHPGHLPLYRESPYFRIHDAAPFVSTEKRKRGRPRKEK